MTVAYNEQAQTVTVGGHTYQIPQQVCRDQIGDHLISTMTDIHGLYETVVIDAHGLVVAEHHHQTEQRAQDSHRWLVCHVGQGYDPADFQPPDCGECGDAACLPHPASGFRFCDEPTVPCPRCVQ
jgi:hypothetical protein